jgi:hypothetical protein
MSRVFTILAILLLLCGVSFSQSQWQFVKNFPNDDFKVNTGCHGIAVDPDGKIWIQAYGATDSIVDATSGRKRACRVIYVFNSDGTPAPISGFKTITVGTRTDTLYLPNVGLRRDHEGNILIASATVMYRVNYKTGAGMNRVQPNPAKTIVAPAVAKNTGDIYTGAVIPPDAIRIYDKDFNLIGNAVDTSKGFARSFEVAADGNTIYWAGFTNNALYKYTRATEFDPFPVKPDTILKGFACESAAWHPKTGYLWLSAGSFNNRANAFPGAKTSWSNNAWYAYNTATDQLVDSLKWVFNTPNNANERPRAIDFSVGGDTVYVGCFGASNYPAVQMFVRKTVKVEERNPVVVEGYSLSQNYPNPFNPVTEIRFSIGKPGLTTVKVYNLLGAEVATLVNEYLPAGERKVMFDAARLPSGTYIYELRANSVRLTKKMTVMK